MKFQYEGVEYDTDSMVAFPTRNRAMPFIYLTSDFSEVFVQTMDRVQGVVIRRASVEEVCYLAQAHQLPMLLRAAQPSQSPAQPGQPPGDSVVPGRDPAASGVTATHPENEGPLRSSSGPGVSDRGGKSEPAAGQ